MKRIPVAAAIFFLLACMTRPLSAQTAAGATVTTVLPADPAGLLGLSPAAALERFGPPARVFAVRGAEPWQDDVVFDYAGGFSLFLFKDKVWQIRIVEAHAAPVFGFAVGLPMERAVAILGTPDRTLPGASEWVLPGDSWPVRLRGVVDTAGSIHELYVYRADF